MRAKYHQELDFETSIEIKTILKELGFPMSIYKDLKNTLYFDDSFGEHLIFINQDKEGLKEKDYTAIYNSLFYNAAVKEKRINLFMNKKPSKFIITYMTIASLIDCGMEDTNPWEVFSRLVEWLYSPTKKKR